MDEQRQVLIVGGSMVGLSAAMFLAHQGIRPLLVERHAEISAHPRAQAASPRTMELLRPLGLEPAIRARETPNARYGNIVQVESLAGQERGWFDGPFRHDTHGASATGWTLIGQDRLEPILRAHAEKLGADIRFGTELVRYEQDDSGVRAVIRDLRDGSEGTVRAEYLIAADGNRSPIRDGLGIGTHGQGVFGRQMIVLFQADLTEYVAGREFFLCFVSNDSVHGVLGQLGASSDGRWCLAVSLAADAGHEDYTEQQCADMVRAAVGVPDLAVKIDDVDSWEIAARIADKFRSGRVFLAGDSAHIMPPTGGFGGNMGIQDAHNLAWKLALVLDGRAGEELLTTYESERAPVAEFTVEQGVIRYLLRSGLDEETKRRHRPEATVLFGHVYDGTVEDPTEPSLRPGTRAPHMPVEDGDVHDLMRGRFVLLATPGARWPDAAAEAAARLDVPIEAHELAEPFQQRYGIEPGGAVLVRPDGFIAWRTTESPEDPAGALVDVLCQFLHLPAWVG